MMVQTAINQGWELLLLGDICKTTSGGTPSRSVKAYFQGEIPWVKSGELPDGPVQSVSEYISEDAVANSSAKVFPAGTLLIALYGATVGRLGILNFDAASNQAVCAIFPKNGIETKYLFWHLRNVRSDLIKKAVGGAQPNISQGILRHISVPVPPFDQQKRIVEEIEKQFSRLDEAVANLKRVKANLKRYKASVLQAAVTGKLTEEWRKQHLPAPVTRPGKFYTYAILCEDDSIYIGHTNDIERRWREHREDQGAEWTKERKPVKIAHYEEFDSREKAAEREKWLKTGFGRKWIKREFAAGRTRQAGDVEPASTLLERILTERRRKWEETELAKMRAKGKEPKNDKWKEKYKEPSDPNVSGRPELPENWTYCTTEQLFSFVTSGSRGWAKYYTDTGALFLRVGNLDHDVIELDLTDIQRVSPPLGAEGTRTQVQANDILISITADVGMIAVVPDGLEQAFINQHISLARPVCNMNAIYLAWYLTAKAGQHQFQALQRGATKVGLSLDDIRAVNVPISPLEEQLVAIEEIESRLSIAEKIERTVDASLQRAKRLRQSILKQAFSGKLVGK